MGAKRDEIAVGICNWVLRHIATEWTEKFVGGAIEYGMRAAARDERTGAPPPADWRTGNVRRV